MRLIPHLERTEMDTVEGVPFDVVARIGWHVAGLVKYVESPKERDHNLEMG
jgi:hypothetical protein